MRASIPVFSVRISDHCYDGPCDSYIVKFMHDTESYYERGKSVLMYLNNIKFPRFMLKVLYCASFAFLCKLPLVSITCLFTKYPCIGSGLDLNVGLFLLLDALFHYNSYPYESFFKIIMPILMAIKKELFGRQPNLFFLLVCFCFFESWKLLLQ